MAEMKCALSNPTRKHCFSNLEKIALDVLSICAARQNCVPFFAISTVRGLPAHSYKSSNKSDESHSNAQNRNFLLKVFLPIKQPWQERSYLPQRPNPLDYECSMCLSIQPYPDSTHPAKNPLHSLPWHFTLAAPCAVPEFRRQGAGIYFAVHQAAAIYASLFRNLVPFHARRCQSVFQCLFAGNRCHIQNRLPMILYLL